MILGSRNKRFGEEKKKAPTLLNNTWIDDFPTTRIQASIGIRIFYSPVSVSRNVRIMTYITAQRDNFGGADAAVNICNKTDPKKQVLT